MELKAFSLRRNWRKNSLKNWRSMPIRNKLLSCFLAVSLVPIIIIGLISYSSSKSAITQKISKYAAQELNQTVTNLKMKLNGYENIPLQFIANPDTNKLLVKYVDEGDTWSLTKYFVGLLSNTQDVSSVLFLVDGEKRQPFMMGDPLPPKYIKSLYQSDVYQKIKDIMGGSIWTLVSRQTTDKDLLMLATSVNNLENGDFLGIVVIFVKEDGFNRFINSEIYSNPDATEKDIKGNYSIIINQQGLIISSPYKKDLGKKITDILRVNNQDSEFLDGKSQNGNFICRVHNVNTLTTYRSLGLARWYILSIAPTSYLFSEATAVGLTTLLLGLLFGVLAIGISIFVSYNISEPLNSVVKAMKKAEEGDFVGVNISPFSSDLTFPFEGERKGKIKAIERNDVIVGTDYNGSDEIAALCKSFNKMLEKIQELVEKNKKEQEELKKYELKLMQAQINPHFLYNTLDAIVWMTESNDKKEVIELTKMLSTFFRITLSKGVELITVKDEVEHVNSYLSIQRMRYRDILNFEIKVSEDLYGFRILKLTLQPIVENALYHGIKNSKTGGLILVSGKKLDDKKIMFEITDNGIGMTEEKLKQIVAGLDDGSVQIKESGFGLKNVNQRLKLYYGKEFGLMIDSQAGVGTRVTIVVPAE